jgi:hypothetical protein
VYLQKKFPQLSRDVPPTIGTIIAKQAEKVA